jgi:ABC-type uncharacterized transport system ATPase subunit
LVVAAQACSNTYLPEERGLYTSMKVGEQCLYLAQNERFIKSRSHKQLTTGLKKLKQGLVKYATW